MGAMSFFRNKSKSKRPQCGGLVSESFGEVEPKPDNYVPTLSMVELQNADWVRFAAVYCLPRWARALPCFMFLPLTARSAQR